MSSKEKTMKHMGFFEHWKAILRLLKNMKGKFVLLTTLMMITAIIDVTFPLLTAYTIDNVIIKGSTEELWKIAIGYLAVGVSFGTVIYLFFRVAFYIEAIAGRSLRFGLFSRIQQLSMDYFDKNPVGATISRITSDTGRLAETIAWGLLDVIWALGFIVVVAVIMLVINYKLALLILSMMPLLSILSFFLSKKIMELQRIIRATNSKIISQFNDGISGAKTSKSLVRERRNIQEFSETTDEMYRSSMHSAYWSKAYWPMASFLSSIAGGLVIYFGGGMVMQQELTFGNFALFMTYSTMFFDPILQVTQVISDLIRAQAAGERVLGLMRSESSITDRPDVVERYGDFIEKKTENWEPIHGDIEFENVDFYYKEGEYVLKNFNLKIAQGTTVAIVGRTGAGKSTIVNLACRFYEPVSGRVLIDGVDYRERSQAWLHSGLGYVLQSPFLFTGTIRDNILYGKPDATDEEIHAAAKLVNAHDFIMKLEKGYETEVGEGGAMLSTGQKQLVSFARAIIGKPRIFVLDEATSSIDTETEAMIQDSVNTLLSGRTSFVIAHRLSTIRNADLILVVEDGSIIERGTHKELMAKRGHYYNLYTNQYYNEKSSEMLGRTSA